MAECIMKSSVKVREILTINMLNVNLIVKLRAVYFYVYYYFAFSLQTCLSNSTEINFELSDVLPRAFHIRIVGCTVLETEIWCHF